MLDVQLPGGYSGQELAAKIHELRPNIGCVLMSGWAEDELDRHGPTPSGCLFLHKPFTRDELLEALSSAIELRMTGQWSEVVPKRRLRRSDRAGPTPDTPAP
jgi:FixJ family two-component response regulator